MSNAPFFKLRFETLRRFWENYFSTRSVLATLLLLIGSLLSKLQKWSFCPSETGFPLIRRDTQPVICLTGIQMPAEAEFYSGTQRMLFVVMFQQGVVLEIVAEAGFQIDA